MVTKNKKAFRDLLEESGLTQRQFAALYGTTPETVNRWHADPAIREGALEPPKAATVILFAFTKMNGPQKEALLSLQ